jgi:transcription antitermination factor NusG
LKKGQSVKILRGAFEGKLALYDGMAAHERERVLLDLLGRYTPLVLPARDIVAATVE